MTRVDRVMIIVFALAVFILPAAGIAAVAVPAREGTPSTFRCVEDAICWNALIDGNHAGHVSPLK